MLFPGITTEDEAALLIDSIPEIDLENVGWKGPWNDFSNVLLWDFTGGKQSGGFYFRAGKITEIVLTDNLGVNLQYVIQEFGSPGELVISRTLGGDTPFIYINFLFPDQGIVFSSKSHFRTSIIVDPDLMMHRVIFLDPTKFEDTFNSDSPAPWIDEKIWHPTGMNGMVSKNIFSLTRNINFRT